VCITCDRGSKLRYLLAIFLAWSVSHPAHAQAGWKVVAFTNTGSVWYARVADLDILTGDRRKIWVKQDHSRNKTVTIRETKTLYWVECGSRSLAALSWVAIRPNGTVADTGDIPDYQARFSRVVPDSVGEGLVSSVCAAGTPWNMEP